MQRVRIGLTGLASVFLLVLLGAIFVKFVREGEAARHADIAVASSSGVPGANQAELPKEPLAELGIAPGNAPDHSANGAKAPPPSN